MIRFILNDKSDFDCVLKIKDIYGTKEYLLSTLNGENYLDAEIYGDKFELTLIPQDADYKSVLEEIPTESFGERLATKFLGKVLSSEEKYFLLAECRYELSGISDGQVIEIDPQIYACTNLPVSSPLDLLALRYYFFEVSSRTSRFDLTDAKVLNKDAVLKSYKKVAISSYGLDVLWEYPLKMSYPKHYVKNEVATEKLKEFIRMNEEQRQKMINRSREFYDLEI